MALSEAGKILLESRYLLSGETVSDMFQRVARAVNTGREAQFCQIMEDLLFLPNSPTLMNAGTPKGQLSACFVLPVEDSIQGIFTSLTQMAMIHKSGGGTGFSFSRIRPAGDVVGTAAGIASGPLSFIRVFDEATSALKQGGRRRGANMGVLASSHPDVLSFIRAKKNGDLKNFNLSVGIDRHFFDSYDRKGTYDLINPRNGEVSRTIDTGILWEELCSAAWQCGDPGILFLDRINDLNPVPGLGPIEATNPCGEQPLLPYESCNLGSLNVAGFVRKGELDEDKLVSAVRSGVEFLDAVIDINTYPVPEIRDRTLLTRKIGLGIMGLADALIIMEIPYASNEGLTFAESIMQLIQQEAHIASEELGEKKGSFPAIDKSWYPGPMRNATVTTVAPTGSLHIIAGTSSGIEPLFSLAFSRIINGKAIRFVHPAVRHIVESLPRGQTLMELIERTGSVQNLPIRDCEKELLRTAPEIKPEFHVRMQAVVQKNVDNAVSKTVNLPEHATLEEISEIFLLARTLGCKGITVYRYNSRQDQVLSRGCDTCRVDGLGT
ncbi:MAG: adenosylcobalamin-dependent ribonucleoside-diphosphate reductase [Methanomicrobiales archaeon]|jgi:ribonucleoside-diphosphate reductase alpha chain|nr:adenosylcobalamin-dependent ribonucleoside-diphosphate reductase [Methanoregulaceae archaeon]HNO07288.1 adenosylcobalamin-dependent ribonucleoside-diphosphate reductase [Methanoregulaceae archaeon]HOU80118.1 adenosylcobalamin-dependent ribonucleoside-diphosphate reductase [Methanoregulaceae archaeon]HPA08103.1 adenosylcobalamin-dependent ribonucleoside-diphosphate reductase [Methanoregulaceae archaeon]HPS22405.1 adenosylcobalamin-dependent ribonucleoside-diphosphate reductase [Methanoregulac